MASGGYTVKLPPGTRVPDSYYCPLCKLLLRNAVQTSEGDRLCEECFKTIAKYGNNMHAYKPCIQTFMYCTVCGVCVRVCGGSVVLICVCLRCVCVCVYHCTPCQHQLVVRAMPTFLVNRRRSLVPLVNLRAL